MAKRGKYAGRPIIMLGEKTEWSEGGTIGKSKSGIHADEIRKEIMKLDNNTESRHSKAAMKRMAEFEEKLDAIEKRMLVEAKKCIIGKACVHFATGRGWEEITIGVVEDVMNEKVQFGRCVVFHNAENKYFSMHNRPYLVEFDVTKFDDGFYKTKGHAKLVFGNNKLEDFGFGIRVLGEQEAESLIEKCSREYIGYRNSMIEKECSEYSEFVSDMFGDGERKYNFNDVSEFIKRIGWYGKQVYDSPGMDEEYMEEVYDEDGVSISICPAYDYYVVCGLDEEDYRSLEEAKG